MGAAGVVAGFLSWINLLAGILIWLWCVAEHVCQLLQGKTLAQALHLGSVDRQAD
jgi:hypothetical protein